VLTCIAHWSQSDVIIRDVCQFVDNTNYEKMMKKAYLAFVDNAKAVSWRNYDAVAFLVNGLVVLHLI
jgi:hypothetical protein